MHQCMVKEAGKEEEGSCVQPRPPIKNDLIISKNKFLLLPCIFFVFKWKILV